MSRKRYGKRLNRIFMICICLLFGVLTGYAAFNTNVKTPTDNWGINALITIAAPVTPPAAKLLGEKKYSTEIATKIIPNVIIPYSLICFIIINRPFTGYYHKNTM